ncbi:MAG TPA: response regulator [Bryobacteraceae bacterium]|nr:response regulator [Bryobacteraceae bacterium]
MERQDLEQWKAKEVARLLALVETERRYYQEMVAMLPVALVVLTSDRRISSANRAFRQTFGLRSSELHGKTIDQILPSERLIEKIHDAHTSGVPPAQFSFEHEGRLFSVGIVAIRNWDDESEIETLLVFQSVPPVLQAPVVQPNVEASLEIPAIVWQADPLTLAFQSVRGDFESLLGFPASHWTGTPDFFETRIHPGDRAATLALYRAASGDASAEFRGVTASGESVWMRETVRHGASAITGVMTPIERRRQFEDQLLRAGRTEALQGVAAKLAHDLNNPLMIVTGYAEEMRATLREDDPVRGDVEEILSATGRISGITTQLLHFTRKQAFPAEPMNVTQVLEHMDEPIAQAAGEGVAIHLTGELVWALAEPKQFEEVILALVSRDREGARERTNLTITCQTDTVTDYVPGAALAPGVYTRVAIHDDGRGVEESKRRAAFEAFLSKPGEKTAGPAIARAYAIVREWGGDIALLSDPGCGSTLLVYLLHCPAPEPVHAEVPAVAGIPAPLPPAPVVRETILLVEDEPGIRALVRKILRRENYAVLEAGSAEEAIAMASTTGQIDLLVTDVMLPNQSGRALAEHLLAQRPHLKVLYVSGYTDDDSVRAGTIPPGSRFLQKPFTLGALVEKVKESLAG